MNVAGIITDLIAGGVGGNVAGEEYLECAKALKQSSFVAWFELK